MIKVSDLKRIKKTNFDRIAKNCSTKRDLAVKFLPINESVYSIIMSNGEDYARIIADKKENFDEFQISWEDFCRICDIFEQKIKVSIKNNIVEFVENKTKYQCKLSESVANNFCNFKFDFNESYILDLDDCFVVTNQGAKGSIDKFALSKNKLVSTDGCIAIVNTIDENLGDNIILLAETLPQGSWYFNPKIRLIVSEDKRIATTIRKATENYPFDGLVNLSEQNFSNWFLVDSKDFKNTIEKCSSIDEKIKIEFSNNHINLISSNMKNYQYKNTLEVEYNHVTSRKYLMFAYKYLKEFYKCSENGKIKIFFEDNESEFKLKAIGKNVVIFAVGMK